MNVLMAIRAEYRFVGLLTITAKDSNPPLVRDTLPAMEVTCARLPVFTRNWPATDWSVRRVFAVPTSPGMDRPSACATAAPILTLRSWTSTSVVAVSLEPSDRPEQSAITSPLVDTPNLSSSCLTTLVAPVGLFSLPVALASRRPNSSASVLSECRNVNAMISASVADWTVAIGDSPWGTRCADGLPFTVMPYCVRRCANVDAASAAGVIESNG